MFILITYKFSIHSQQTTLMLKWLRWSRLFWRDNVDWELKINNSFTPFSCAVFYVYILFQFIWERRTCTVILNGPVEFGCVLYLHVVVLYSLNVGSRNGIQEEMASEWQHENYFFTMRLKTVLSKCKFCFLNKTQVFCNTWFFFAHIAKKLLLRIFAFIYNFAYVAIEGDRVHIASMYTINWKYLYSENRSIESRA